MRHCCEFDSYDIWYLENTADFSDRVLYFGTFPICQKNVSTLIQRNIKTNVFITVKKVGDSAINFIKNCSGEKIFSRNEVNKMKITSKPYSWVYGINKEKKNKDGTISINQYATDFFGNSILVKKI